MKQHLKKIFKEPLFHFVLIGISFFILYGLFNNESNSRDNIIIDEYDLENIIAGWELQWNKPPTEQELINLIKLDLRQEIFYLEALNMNLDHNDEIIKRRLAQKMEFLSNDLARSKVPTDEELKLYYERHADKYLKPSSFTFYQIVFSPDNRKDNYSDAEVLLAKNPNSTFDEMKNKGDKLPFSYYYQDINADDLTILLGSLFTDSIKDIELNKWVGPVPSGFGYHLVYLEKRTAPQPEDLEKVKTEVLVNYEYDNQKAVIEAIYDELKKKYKVDFEVNSDKYGIEFIEKLQKEVTN